MKMPLFVSNVDGVSDEAIRSRVPAVFAQAPHESRSSSYVPISTIDVIKVLRSVGLVPVSAMQARPRAEDRLGTAKHMVRFRLSDQLGRAKADTYEAVLINSFGGESSWILEDGWYRLVCTNGMVRWSENESRRVPHKGKDVLERVVESTLKIVEEAPRIAEEVDWFKSIKLSRPEQVLLAQSAFDERFDINADDEAAAKNERAKSLYRPESFLQARRDADVGDDLWRTFQRLQENFTKGHVRASKVDEHGEIHHTREIKSIDGLVGFNKRLWRMTQQFAALKSQM